MPASSPISSYGVSPASSPVLAYLSDLRTYKGFMERAVGLSKIEVQLDWL